MIDGVQLSISQIASAWRLMCSASNQRAMDVLDGLDMVFSGLPISFFNIGLVTTADLSADALADSSRRASGWAGGKGVPWFFIVTHERLRQGVDAAAVLDTCGLAPVMPLTGMVAATVAPSPRRLEGLRLTTPKDDAECHAFIALNSKAYAMDLAAAAEIVGRQAFWDTQFPVVALKDGTPAACAGVLMVEGHRYVALVATDPEQQRRGFADASMRLALANAAAVHGEAPTVLHATEAGRPVYQRMGYTRIANHTLFMEKRFLVEH